MTKLLLYFFGTAFLLLSGLIITVYVCQEKIKAAIIGELNEHLQAEVLIDPADIDLTVISTFPQCALRFRNTLMLEALKKKDRDTLLFAGQVQLQFSVMDIWRGRYEIRKLNIEHGLARMAVSKDGTANYVFWKGSGPSDADSTRFHLDDVTLKDIRLEFDDWQKQLRVRTLVKELRMRGDFSSDEYRLKAYADLHVGRVQQADAGYLADKRIIMDVELGARGDTYQLTEAMARINGMSFAVKGGFSFAEERLAGLDLEYHAPDADIASLLSLLPQKFRSSTANYESTGLIYVDGTVKFALEKWSVTGSFGARDVAINYRPGNTRAENVNFEGSFEAGPVKKVEIRHLNARLAGGEISGALKVTDFSDPRIVCELSASGDLRELHRFFPVDTLEELSGNFKLDLGLAGRLQAIEQAKLTGETNLRLQCAVSDFFARFRHDPKGFSVSSCELHADKGEVAVRNLHLKRGASELTINGRLPGFIEYLTNADHRTLIIRGDLYAPVLHVEDFLPGESTSSSQAGSAGPLIPADLTLELGSRIDRLTFGKFNAGSVNGLVEVRGRKLMVTDVQLATMQGTSTINFLADNSRGKLQVSAEARLSRLNLKELFSQMNNFGQSTLRDDQIRGFATADITFSGVWDNALECDLNSIAAGCDFDVEKGELVGFKPLQSLGKFVEVTELENIQFSRLTGRVDIASGRITIPRTSIRNSALDIEFWGSHTFDHRIDYHFQLLMSDLFAAKHKSLTNTEFGEVARDAGNRRSVFVLMTGHLDDPKIRYDRQGLKQKIRNDIALEKQNMKALLKEEFGLFRKDETVKSVPAQQPVFKLETQASQTPPKKELVLKKKEEEDF